MKLSCAMPERRFGLIGAAFTAIGVAQPGFLPAGLALLTVAAVRQWRVSRRT